MTPRVGPGQLATLLAALEVRVESVRVVRSAVSLPDYPGGPRPSSVVRFDGSGHSGYGENVAFQAHEHERFEARVGNWSRAITARARSTVGEALATEGTPYERAALEAGLIDLALRQSGQSLFDLTGVQQAPLRFLRSLSTDADLQAALRQPDAQLKVDVDPNWSAAWLEALAGEPRIVIFDFKGIGSTTLAERVHALHPRALLEDPPTGFLEPPETSPTRISRDATLLDEHAVAAARVKGEAVNLKAPRMGGPLTVLRALSLALAPVAGDSVPASCAYLGGMFEVSVGREQARQLAALYCANAPNDLALNVVTLDSLGRERDRSPASVRLDQPGFGSNLARRDLLRP